MNINRKLPVWAIILLDLILVAAIILPFAYFHHVRDMWGISNNGEVKTTYGDGEKVVFNIEDRFLSEGEAVSLEGNEIIRSYAEEQGIPLEDSECSYLSFYRSQNIYTALYAQEQRIDGSNKKKVYIYDVFVRDVNCFFTVAGAQKDMHELISEGENYSGGKVIAAINGDYSSNKNHCRVVVRNGGLYRDAGEYDSDICVMYYDGSIETYDYKDFDMSAVEARKPYQIWDFGPALLGKDGKAKTAFDDTAYDKNILTRAHPRTALGYYEPGHYCFIIVDGRQEDEDGIYINGFTVAELAQLCEKLGCKSAYNLDGGDSTQAYMNEKDVRISKTRDPQRVLSDIICIGEIADRDTQKEGEA